MDAFIEEMLILFRKLPLEVVTAAHEANIWKNFFTDSDTEVIEIHENFNINYTNAEFKAIINDILNPLQTVRTLNARRLDLSTQNSDNYQSKTQSDDNVNNSEGSFSNQSSEMRSREKSSFWSCVLQNGVSPRQILVLLFTMLRYGNLPRARAPHQEIGILCATLYFNILSIPGCGAYRIFQFAIIEEALNSLNLSKEPNLNKENKQGGAKNVNLDDDDMSDDEINGNGNSLNSAAQLSFSSRQVLVAGALKNLILMLENYSLKADKEVIPILAKSLTELLLIFPDFNAINFKNENLTRSSVSSLIFKTLSVLSKNDFHGDSPTILIQVLKNVLPIILMTGSNKQQLVIKENTIEFVKFLLKENGEKASTNVTIFLQQLCIQAPEKSEGRQKIAQMVVSLIKDFPEQQFKDALVFFGKLLKQSKVNYRMTALDIFHALLTEHQSKCNLYYNVQNSKAIILDIFLRCNDKSALVRAKALSILSQETTPLEYLLNANTAENEPVMLKKMVTILINRSQDDRATVRKAVLLVLERLICLDESNLTVKANELFRELCHDGSLMVRKQVCVSITSILQHHATSCAAQSLWINTVLPLILDKETSVQEKVLDCTCEVVLNNLYLNKPLAWSILNVIITGKHQEQKGYLKKLIQFWVKGNKIKPNLIGILEQQINTESDAAVWAMISNLTMYKELNNTTFILNAWSDRKDVVELSSDTLRNLLEIIGNCANKLSGNQKKVLIQELQERILLLKLPARTIETGITTVSKLASSLHHNNNNKQLESIVQSWVSQVMAKCCEYLKNIFSQKKECMPFTEEEEEEKILRSIITIGDIYRLTTKTLLNDVAIRIETLAFANIVTSETPLLSQPLPFSCSTVPSGTQSSSVLNVPARIKIEALVSFGKFCLQNEKLAKDSILLFVKELQESVHISVRNNIVIILADFCVRYPSLVEPYISSMTLCIHDPSSFVRHQTIATLTQLLQEDYIKWKGSLFYRMLFACQDHDTSVSRLVKFALVHLLSQRHPKFFSQSFVKAIFYFNGYNDETEGNVKVSTDNTVEKPFLLMGPENLSKRKHLYTYLLNNMTANERFHVYPRLCDEIILPITKGAIKLSTNSYGLLQDSLVIMACDEIKTQIVSTANTEDCLEEVEMEHVQQLNVAMKRSVIENLIPIIITLKAMLQKAQSPLLKDLMLFLKEFLKDFKSDIKEILKADPQLAKEIEYDLKCFEKEQEQLRSEQQKSFSSSRSEHRGGHRESSSNGPEKQAEENLQNVNKSSTEHSSSSSKSSSSGKADEPMNIASESQVPEKQNEENLQNVNKSSSTNNRSKSLKDSSTAEEPMNIASEIADECVPEPNFDVNVEPNNDSSGASDSVPMDIDATESEPNLIPCSKNKPLGKVLSETLMQSTPIAQHLGCRRRDFSVDEISK